jgi:hypothetical protein
MAKKATLQELKEKQMEIQRQIRDLSKEEKMKIGTWVCQETGMESLDEIIKNFMLQKKGGQDHV